MLLMLNMAEIVENTIIDSWAKHLPRAPFQINKLHETDSELIELPGDPEHYLAITIDTVSEEINYGLYRYPHTMGWVTVMASLSDLAAVGAKPLGLVVSSTVEPFRDMDFTNRVAQGMEDACRAGGVYILGGDTNSAPRLSLTSCAVGLVQKQELLTRHGCKLGDAVYSTAGVGIGNALGLARLANMSDSYFTERSYRPFARLREGRLLRKHASCCMDTSDGLLTTLDQLMRINQLGFEIDCDWERILSPRVVEFCNQSKTPYWLMTAGPHGEFELVFTIPAGREDSFLEVAYSQGMNPTRLGRVQQHPAISLNLLSGRRVDVNVAALRNLIYTVDGDMDRYLREFWALGKKWGVE
jgi:thiamine-monophosphate kinase